MSLNKIKITKNIDSILQVTNDVIYKSNNYREYILNQNNSLYMRQLPLLMKHERMKALISKKIEDTQKNSSSLIFQEEDKEKEIKEKSKLNLYKHLSPLSNIRNIKIKSKKLPPLYITSLVTWRMESMFLVIFILLRLIYFLVN